MFLESESVIVLICAMVMTILSIIVLAHTNLHADKHD